MSSARADGPVIEDITEEAQDGDADEGPLIEELSGEESASEDEADDDKAAAAPPPPPPPPPPEALLAEARGYKERGNVHFKAQEWDNAISCYTQAIDTMPEEAPERAVFFANRAAAFAKIGEHEGVIDDCTQAIALQPEYTKAFARRAIAREKLNEPTLALEDAKKAAELDPSDKALAASVDRLEKASAAKLEEQKEEMIGKLKELGNSVLGKFGMSLDNFNAVQDPTTGSYNISFGQPGK